MVCKLWKLIKPKVIIKPNSRVIAISRTPNIPDTHSSQEEVFAVDIMREGAGTRLRESLLLTPLAADWGGRVLAT